jgi:hypothetical protein
MPFYSTIGRPSIDPEPIIRTLVVGYCFGIRSERLCEEVDLNLAYCWFCRLGLEGRVPDHSIFSKTGMVASATVMGSVARSSWWCSARWLRASPAVKASPSTPV